MYVEWFGGFDEKKVKEKDEGSYGGGLLIKI